jgi:hypothetical protein
MSNPITKLAEAIEEFVEMKIFCDRHPQLWREQVFARHCLIEALELALNREEEDVA